MMPMPLLIMHVNYADDTMVKLSGIPFTVYHADRVAAAADNIAATDCLKARKTDS